MSNGRPAIPRALERAVKVEAGHRCAIPTCRATSGLEIHHIVEYSAGGAHAFDNLILLCAICHSRVTKGEIDRVAVRAYKANLGLLVSRYGDLERRVLEHFVKHRDARELALDYSHALLLRNLVDDGLLELAGPARGALIFATEADPARDPSQTSPTDIIVGPASWRITEQGLAVVLRIRTAREVE